MKTKKGRLYCHSVQQSTAIIAVRTKPVELVVEYGMIISGPLGALARGTTLCHSNRLNNQDARSGSNRSFAALWK